VRLVSHGVPYTSSSSAGPAEDVRLVTGAALDGVVERREEGHTRNAHLVRL
jgi:hypothetical protein